MQELIDDLCINSKTYYENNIVFLNTLIEKEKQQIIDACCFGLLNSEPNPFEGSEYYYNPKYQLDNNEDCEHVWFTNGGIGKKCKLCGVERLNY